MATDSQTAGLTIPDETKEQFPELVSMIKDSQSMNDEERQYWVDVLPIMTEEQLTNLRDILTNEKEQIEEINKSYDKEIDDTIDNSMLEFDEFKYKEKKRMREEAEKMFEKEEHKREAALLEEISNM